MVTAVSSAPLEGHCLRLCVLQKRHVLLIHQGEVVLELETEHEPGLLVVDVLDRFRSKLQGLLRCSPSSYHTSATMRKFCLLCETIDDQRRSTRRLHDVDTCANDLRVEMAHLSQFGMSVLMKVKLRTTENKRACASNCALTSTSLSQHKSGSNGLFHTSSCRKHLIFFKGSRYWFTQ